MTETKVVHEPHVIHSLEDAVSLLQRALNDELDHYHLEVEDLEKFSMHLVGKKFHQTITPSVMKGFIDLQNAIYRSYAQIKYNDPSILRLSKQEKDDLELEIKVIDGSSGFGFDPQELFDRLIGLLADKLNSKHVFVLVLSSILLYSGYQAYNDYLTTQKEVRLAEISLEKDVSEKQERLATVALLSGSSNQTTKEVLEQAAAFSPQVKTIQQEATNASHSLIKSAQAADTIDFNNGEIQLSGEAAKELSKTSPSKWREVRIDGVFFIINVDSSHAAKRKIRIRNMETQQEILAILENDTLDQKNLNLIQEAEWGYTPIHLKVRAKELNGIYKESEILEATQIEKHPN